MFRHGFYALPLVVLGLALCPGCNPMGCFAPADLPRDAPLVVASTSKDAPVADVDVVLDELGVPHIYGRSQNDLAYGLGFLHGRDRQFQVFVYVHAALGRLTELLGEDLLPIDRQNRLLTHRLDEQVANLSDVDRALIESYVAGLNDGARHTGRSAEMVILGVEWEELETRDVLAIMRLQQWDQSVGFAEEMARWRLSKAVGIDDPRMAVLWVDTPSNGLPIVDAATHSGDAFAFGADRPRTRYHRAPGTPTRTRAADVDDTQSRRRALVEGVLRDLKVDVGARFGRGGTGHSNEWVVDGAHNSSGVPVLCNDPHLGHAAPGVFYMVHMEAPDFTVAGGSFPGIPGVLIGHGRHIAWGITNAYADVQDVVVLRPVNGNPDLYELDGAPMNFTRVRQRFALGKGEDAEVVEEDFLVSVLGPVLPQGYGSYDGAESWVDDDERLVLQWTAAEFPERSGHLIGAFWDLARAKTIAQAHEALQAFIAPAMSVAIAISDNDEGPAGIHYRLSGIIPVRGDDQRVDFPRDGASRRSGFVGVLDAAQKPQLDNPAAGFFVAANQRVVDNGVLSQRFVGYEGARHFRASRIHERLAEMLADGGKPTPEELLSIQQDVESVEARELAPIFGAHCPKTLPGFDDDLVARLCAAVADFDGVYTKEARALPFARLHRSFIETLLRRHMSEDLALDLADQSFVQMAVHELVKRAGAGESTDADRALLDDPHTRRVEGFDDVVARAAEEAFALVVSEAGAWESDWRWAKLHTLTFKGILARAPVIGMFFETSAHEESGAGTAPRAEASSPSQRMRVTTGAGLRHLAVMKETPEVKMVNDTGASGHFGHRHLESQYPLWTKGEPRVLWRTQDDVTKTNDGLLRLTPK